MRTANSELQLRLGLRHDGLHVDGCGPQSTHIMLRRAEVLASIGHLEAAVSIADPYAIILRLFVYELLRSKVNFTSSKNKVFHISIIYITHTHFKIAHSTVSTHFSFGYTLFQEELR